MQPPISASLATHGPRKARLTLLWTLLAALPASGQRIEDKQVDSIVQPLVDEGYCHGLVVGIVDNTGTRVRGYGSASEPSGPPPNGDTVFEIGSISKVFTSLLLADAVEQSHFKLDDPVSRYLPPSVHLAVKGRPITLLDLATHASGLPRLPSNLFPANPENPYASYSAQALYDFLNAWQPYVGPGEKAEYSNLGAGLLGHALSLRESTSYEELLLRRIAGPLGMSSTCVALSDALKKRLATPHDADGKIVKNWDFPSPLTGCGGIRSTAGDMLKFVQAQLQPPAGLLGDAIRLTQQRHGPFDAQRDIGLGWLIDRRGFFMHNGATGGYHSFAAFSVDRKVGVVVLANDVGGWSELAGARIICALIGADPGPVPALHHTVTLDPAKLDRFAGNYLVGFSLLTIRREDNRLYAIMMGQPELRIYPESERSCFWKAIDAQAEFTFDPMSGKTLRLMLHRNGGSVIGLRLPTTLPSTTPAAG